MSVECGQLEIKNKLQSLEQRFCLIKMLDLAGDLIGQT